MGCVHSATTSAYPGNRRVAKPSYQPSADEYRQVDDGTAVANAHFVTCPGGNALRLLDRPNRADAGGGEGKVGGLARYISVTLPSGVHGGDVIHVESPDGRINAIVVPDGMGPGSTFTVEFASDVPGEEGADMAPGVYVPTVSAVPESAVTGVPTAASHAGMEPAAVAQPTAGPYVPAYAMK